MSKPT